VKTKEDFENMTREEINAYLDELDVKIEEQFAKMDSEKVKLRNVYYN